MNRPPLLSPTVVLALVALAQLAGVVLLAVALALELGTAGALAGIGLALLYVGREVERGMQP